MHKINWNPEKVSADGLIPAIIQDSVTQQVLMLGYFNEESFRQTLETGWVTFFSRSRKRLWQKGETSGNRLQLVTMDLDCDSDTFLVKVKPQGPTCHRNTVSCFGDGRANSFELSQLEQIIHERKSDVASKNRSYTQSLFEDGLDRLAQKVGEEAVETVIAAKNNAVKPLENEAADLVFHLMALLEFRGSSWSKVVQVLGQRFGANRKPLE